MKGVKIFLLVIAISGLTLVQAGNDGQDKKEKASFVKQGIEADNPETWTKQNNGKSFKIRTDGVAKVRKSKEREMMGSASTSGPAVKIEKLNVRQTASPSDLQKVLDQQQNAKMRKKKE